MNWSMWFMIVQVVSCLGGVVAFGIQRNWPIAWVWLCYASANIGFAIIAYKGV